MQRPIQDKGGLLDQVGQGGIRGQAQGVGVAGVADMVGTEESVGVFPGHRRTAGAAAPAAEADP